MDGGKTCQLSWAWLFGQYLIDVFSSCLFCALGISRELVRHVSCSGCWDLSFLSLYPRLERVIDPWSVGDASVLMVMVTEK